MNIYNASVYAPQNNASLAISAPSAIDAAKNLWVAIHGSAIGFNFAQNNQHSECATARDNAHSQWLGGHAGIIVTRDFVVKVNTLFKLTKNDAQEAAHKLGVLADEPDLQEDYGLTQAQAAALRDSVPHEGGEWIVPAWGVEAVRGEMADHCEVLADIAADARSGNQLGQALRISKQAKRLRDVFA